MKYYIKGLITNISENFLIIENSGIGYKIITTNFFVLNQTTKIYIYHHKTELLEEYYGFKTEEQLTLFLKLIEIKGIGCKLAINLTSVDPKLIYNSDIGYLQTFPKIGFKTAQLIIKNLKNDNCNNDLVDALESIGYKKNDIYKVIPLLEEKDLDSQIKQSIQLLQERTK